jgi:hypothetical protein
MQDLSGRREARMMEAVAGLGGRSALGSEIDLRLGVYDTGTRVPVWFRVIVEFVQRRRFLRGKRPDNAGAVTARIEAAE